MLSSVLVHVPGCLTSALGGGSDVEEEVVLVDVHRDSSDDVGILELQGSLGRGERGRGERGREEREGRRGEGRVGQWGGGGERGRGRGGRGEREEGEKGRKRERTQHDTGNVTDIGAYTPEISP